MRLAPPRRTAAEHVHQSPKRVALRKSSTPLEAQLDPRPLPHRDNLRKRSSLVVINK